MTLNIYQAKFGFKNQVGHALLSSNLEEKAVLEELRNLTDLPSNPPYGVAWTEYNSTCCIEDYFVVSKTYPDTSFDRGDTVFTHSFIVPVADLVMISSLLEVFLLFPAKIDKGDLAETPPIIFESSPLVTEKNSTKTRVCIAHLLASNNLAVCSGSNDLFLEAVCGIWDSLPTHLKPTMRYRIGFDPNNIKPNDNIIVIPTALEQKWADYDLVTSSSSCEPHGGVEAVLAGEKPISDNLHSFLKSLGNVSLNFSHLKVIETSEKLLANTDLDSARRLALNVGHLSPEKNESAELKAELLEKFCKLLVKASPSEVLRLRNFPIQAFQDAKEKISSIVSHIISSQFDHADLDSNFISKVQDEHSAENGWWYEATTKAIAKELKTLTNATASKIWSWVTKDASLIEFILSEVGSSDENGVRLTSTSPKEISSETAEVLLAIFAVSGWITLHGDIASKAYKPEIAILKHLSIDSDPNYFEGVHALCANVPNKDLLAYVLANPEVRLLQIVGKNISNQKKLFKGFDASNATWRSIWKESYSHNGDIWFGIKKPNDTTEQLLELLMSGTEIDESLLGAISNTDAADLSDFEKRKDVWSFLPALSIKGFIHQTLQSLLHSAEGNFEEIVNLEPELKSALGASLTVRPGGILSANTHTVALKVKLMREYDLPENTFILFLKNHTSNLSTKDAELLGHTINDRKWKNAAEAIKDVKWKRADLLPAWSVCQSLAPDSFFDNFNIFGKSGTKQQSYSPKPALIMKHTILFMAASPKDEVHLDLMKELATVDNYLQRAKHRDDFDLKSKVAVQFDIFTQAILEEAPQIIHFSGHGDFDGLALEHADGATHFINKDAITQMFGLLSGSVKCVVLNACYSEEQAEAISKYGIYVVGMSDSIDDDAAIAFSGGFYQSIGAGKDIADSFKWALTHITALAQDKKQSEVPQLWFSGKIIA